MVVPSESGIPSAHKNHPCQKPAADIDRIAAGVEIQPNPIEADRYESTLR